MANRDNLNAGTSARSSTGASDWASEDSYWRSNFTSRPYARADRGYESYQPGYRYGFESANRHRGRQWSDAENELRAGWDRFEHRGQSTWEHVKDAVRDAWDRVRGRDRGIGTDEDSRARL